MILVDTNVLSELARPRPEPKVLRWLEENEPTLAIPSVALAELRYGVERLPEGRRRESLSAFWTELRNRFTGRIYSFDERAAEAFGEIAAAADRIGRPISMSDAQIAAIARVNRMRIATRDEGDFSATGLPLVNPWK